MNNIVIIGAGLSGRGYLNRLLYLSGKQVVFLDKNKELIDKLQEAKSYKIEFGIERKSLKINNFEAYHIETTKAIEALSKANLIMISIGANHIKEVLRPLEESLKIRDEMHVDILTAENGIKASRPLVSLQKDIRVHLSESVIFCTTLGNEETLDIFSENLDHLPYDVIALGHAITMHGFVEEKKFPILLERKIYTYNCISACIAYLGYIKGYEDYAKAANDPFIDNKIHQIADVLNESIAKEYQMPLAKQVEFSEMAIKKFKNVNIIDTIERNVRDVERKLSENERLVAPLKIIDKNHSYCEALLEVCASALVYGLDTNTLLCAFDQYGNYFETLPNEWRNKIIEKVVELRN